MKHSLDQSCDHDLIRRCFSLGLTLRQAVCHRSAALNSLRIQELNKPVSWQFDRAYDLASLFSSHSTSNE